MGKVISIGKYPPPTMNSCLSWYVNRQEKLVVLGPAGNGDDDWQEACQSACVELGVVRGPALTREAIGVLMGLRLSWLNYRISTDTPYCGHNLKPLSLIDAM